MAKKYFDFSGYTLSEKKCMLRDLSASIVMEQHNNNEPLVEETLLEKNWIAKAIKHPGALKAKAKAAGAVKDDGTIKKGWVKEKAKGGGKTAKQARLAITLGKFKHEDALLGSLMEDSSDE